MRGPALLCLAALAAALGCAEDAGSQDALSDGDAPSGPAWPPDQPLPEEFDAPPWVTMPSEDRVAIGWWTVDEITSRVEVTQVGVEDPYQAIFVEGIPARLHHLQVGPLPPASGFHYRVVVPGPDGGQAIREGVFTTPGAADWRFLHLAELHAPSQSEHVARFAEVIRAFRPNLVVESGDMVDDGGDWDEWRAYLRVSRPWISNVILLPAHSNHVNGFLGNRQLLSLFELPGNERWYTTRYSQVEFVTVDSTYQASPDVGSQPTWVRRQMTAARDGDADPSFVVGAWHYPACSSHYASRTASREWVMDELVPAFRDGGGLDLMLVGHDKYYERSLLDDGERTIPHVMANAGMLNPGAEGDNRSECSPQVTRTDTRSLVLVRVSPTALEANVVDESGASIDRFTILPAPGL